MRRLLRVGQGAVNVIEAAAMIEVAKSEVGEQARGGHRHGLKAVRARRIAASRHGGRWTSWVLHGDGRWRTVGRDPSETSALSRAAVAHRRLHGW